MARVCDVCGKGKQIGMKVSHAHNRSKREWLPNLQSVRILKDGATKRVRVCTKCIKKGKIQKAV